MNLDFLKDPSKLIPILTVIGLVYEGFFRSWNDFQKLWRFLIRRRSIVPRDTIRVVPDYLRGKNLWAKGAIGSDPAMQVMGSWLVTNITNGDVIIVSASIKKPKTTCHTVDVIHNGAAYSRHPIKSGATANVHALFFIKPPVCKEGQDFKATVILTDQFGNNHQIKNCTFSYIGNP